MVTPTSGVQIVTQNLFSHPFAQESILAGYLKPDEIERVCPASLNCGTDMQAHIQRTLGTGSQLGPRPDAGTGAIFPIEEPEALEILSPFAATVQSGPIAPISFGWVEITNLISPRAVAGPLIQNSLINTSIRGVVEFSLFGPQQEFNFSQNGILVSSMPMRFSLADAQVEQSGRLTVQYELTRPTNFIIVGYNQGQLYLINAYPRVLQAISQNIDRLLCLIYYGLDLSAPNMGVRILPPQIEAVNHFGVKRLSASNPPLVRDFLDPNLSAVVPTRAPVFATHLTLQSFELNLRSPAQGPFPFDISD